MTAARVLVGVSGFAAGIALVAVTVDSRHADAPVAEGILGLLIVWSFVASGLVAWARRPRSRIGPLMLAVGLSWFLASLQAANDSVPYTLGLLCGLLPLGFLVQLILAFPEGRLLARDRRVVAAAAYLTATVGALARVLFLDPQTVSDCPECPTNELMIFDNDGVAEALNTAINVAGAIIALATMALLVRRWRNATAPARRAIAPVLWAGALAGLAGTALFATAITGGQAALVARLVTYGVLSLIPLAFLVGLLRLRLTHLRIIRLVVELSRGQAPGRLREALARALGDPDLQLGYWLPESQTFVDIAGQPLDLPAPRSRRASTVVERDGRRVAVLVHDASLADQRELLDAVGAAAGLALENERLQAELRAKLDELRDSEERLRALIEASPLAIVELDLEDRVTFWNRSAERLFGWSTAEVLGRPIPIVPPGLEEERDRIRDRVFRGEAVGEIETVRLRKDGSRIDVAISTAGVRDASGRVVGIMAELVDVTERRQAQEELRQERDFVSALVDTAPVLVIVFDRDGRLRRFNRECERLTGYTAGEVLGRPFSELFVPPKERASVSDALEFAWAGALGSANENHWVTRDGQNRLIFWSNSALVDERGRVEYVVSAGLDVTERKRAEEELRASRARIVEAGDAERRRLERNLHDGAQQRLIALSLALRMALGQVRSNPEGAEQLIAGASEELSQAIAELRELARGIHPAVLTDRGLEAALEALAGRASMPVDLHVALPEPLPASIEAAAYYVVSEALANVAKYANASAVTVSVGRENGFALVVVADDGVGGADPALGSGLRGLADRVESLDGRLDVESVVGRGTRVRAEIPLPSLSEARGAGREESGSASG